MTTLRFSNVVSLALQGKDGLDALKFYQQFCVLLSSKPHLLIPLIYQFNRSLGPPALPMRPYPHIA